jgi:UDP-2,4-diacetamido-2,4,6-trideoxy-beta-L-altropyranose hydrolase
MIGYIKSRGFSVVKLTSCQKYIEPQNDTDYLGWLHRSPEEDAIDFIDKISTVRWVITDHYAIDKVWHQKVRQNIDCKILSIDDLVREHDAEIILDQTFNRSEKNYKAKECVLAGTSYALLKPEFAAIRDKLNFDKKISEKLNILVSMGGIDPPNATLKILQNLVEKVDANFTVLLSHRAKYYKEVKLFCNNFPCIKHIDFTEDMAKEMIKHDIAIGAPGSTSWERACLGIPSIIVPLADNQTEIGSLLDSNGIAVKVEIDQIEQCLINAIHIVVENFEQMKEKNLAICDGKGVVRVLEKIINLDGLI